MDCFCTWRFPNLLFAFATWSSGVQEAWRIFMISSKTPRLRTSQQRKQRRGCTSLFCFRYLELWSSGSLEDFYDLLRKPHDSEPPSSESKDRVALLFFAFATWSSGVQETWRFFMISSETPRLRTSQQRKQNTFSIFVHP